jgi:hypothetical protein
VISRYRGDSAEILLEISARKKNNFAPSTLYRGRLTDKLIEKLGLLHPKLNLTRPVFTHNKNCSALPHHYGSSSPLFKSRLKD